MLRFEWRFIFRYQVVFASILRFGLAICSFQAMACAHVVLTMKSPCGTAGSPCVASMEVPEDRAKDFESGVRGAIDAIENGSLVAALVSFKSAHVKGTEPWAPAWGSSEPGALVASLRAQLPKERVETFGSLHGLWDKIFYGTIALDGGGSVVNFNRWMIGSFHPTDFANTVAHETSHAIGLTHPHMNGIGKNEETARCEPPYVIGSLVKRILESEAWRWSGEDCIRLRPDQPVSGMNANETGGKSAQNTSAALHP